MSTLHLSLKEEFFEAIKTGTKKEEFRLTTTYWRRRIEGKTFDKIVLALGYPPGDDITRRLVRPWRGYTIQTIQHPLFGPEPVQVFAIIVNE
jgi:hypothetical protein